MPTVAEITTFRDAPPPPGQDPWVPGFGPMTDFHLVAADPAWPERYAGLAGQVTGALGESVVSLAHIGSTSVPGLAAKPVIDIDLTVADSREESAYVPALALRGFMLVIREPWWYEHRCLRHTDPACNLHVFSPGSPEGARHLIFRDWLASHPEDRELYAAAKRAAVDDTQTAGGHSMDYNAAKQGVIRGIYARAFRARGWLDDGPDAPRCLN